MILDLAFPPEHSDFEIGDAFEARGLLGTMEVVQRRQRDAAGGTVPAPTPSDPLEHLAALYMGQCW